MVLFGLRQEEKEPRFKGEETVSLWGSYRLFEAVHPTVLSGTRRPPLFLPSREPDRKQEGRQPGGAVRGGGSTQRSRG